LDQLQCNLSSDGVLQVTAPRTLPSITDGKTEQNGTANNYSTNTSVKKDTNERMTVDGRKVDSATTSAESKYENYAKWKESRGESPVFDNMDNNLTSSKIADSHVTNGTSSTSRNVEKTHKESSGLVSRMQEWDPFFHALPDFDMVPFWKRRFNTSSRLIERDDELFGIQSDLDNFKVLVDVKQFTPEELSVRCTDNFVIIEGKQDEKKDSHGFISRHFTRKYDLPKGVKAEDVQCNLTAAGVLEIKAPKPKSATQLLPPIGRKVPISMGSNTTNGTQSHKVSSVFEERKERSTGTVTSPLADEYTHKINMTPSQQKEQTRREDSVESTMSNANNRRVTIQELSRSSSANSNYNDIHHIHGEHVIPITIAAI
jgi:HSP20 family molecular chaperone IbpA